MQMRIQVVSLRACATLEKMSEGRKAHNASELDDCIQCDTLLHALLKRARSNNPGSKQGACRHDLYKRNQVGSAVVVLTSLVHTEARLSRKTKTNLKQFTGSDY